MTSGSSEEGEIEAAESDWPLSKSLHGRYLSDPKVRIGAEQPVCTTLHPTNPILCCSRRFTHDFRSDEVVVPSLSFCFARRARFSSQTVYSSATVIRRRARAPVNEQLTPAPHPWDLTAFCAKHPAVLSNSFSHVSPASTVVWRSKKVLRKSSAPLLLLRGQLGAARCAGPGGRSAMKSTARRGRVDGVLREGSSATVQEYPRQRTTRHVSRHRLLVRNRRCLSLSLLRRSSPSLHTRRLSLRRIPQSSPSSLPLPPPLHRIRIQVSWPFPVHRRCFHY